MDHFAVPTADEAPITFEAASAISAAPSPPAYVDESDPDIESSDSGSSMSLELSPGSEGSGPDVSEYPQSAVDALPNEVLISIFYYLERSTDLLNVMLTSRRWAGCAVEYLWHRPACSSPDNLQKICSALNNPNALFRYAKHVKRVNLSLLAGLVSDGTIASLNGCTRIERLTLTGCKALTDGALTNLLRQNPRMMALDLSQNKNVTDEALAVVAKTCSRLQGLNITGCTSVTQEGLIKLADGCREMKRLKLNECEDVTDEAVIAFAEKCPNILEIDLQSCRRVGDAAVKKLLLESKALRELRLPHVLRLTDMAFTGIPEPIAFDALRILDLTGCAGLTDTGVALIIAAAPRLRNVVLAKCRAISDASVRAIATLGKNLHYVHLGHCTNITDEGAMHLIHSCNRIRYIDLGCCTNLTDQSVSLLANLPKLKRIGLVKCGLITDRSINKIANSCFSRLKRPAGDGTIGPTLERVHLSYCMNLTVKSIVRLLNACRRLTHLSLTGVPAFLMKDLQDFARPPPIEFTEHQREVFCVFSGTGVQKLRDHLNTSPKYHNTRLLAGIIPRKSGGIDFVVSGNPVLQQRPNTAALAHPIELVPLDSNGMSLSATATPQTSMYPPFNPDDNPNRTGPYDPLLGVDVISLPPRQFNALLVTVQGHLILYEHFKAQMWAGLLPEQPMPGTQSFFVIAVHFMHENHRSTRVASGQPPPTTQESSMYHHQILTRLMSTGALEINFQAPADMPHPGLGGMLGQDQEEVNQQIAGNGLPPLGPPVGPPMGAHLIAAAVGQEQLLGNNAAFAAATLQAMFGPFDGDVPLAGNGVPPPLAQAQPWAMQGAAAANEDNELVDASAVKDPSTINLDCLKQITADQAFTNAKAAGDLRGMAGALVYQALERNTAGVGVKSAACNETATNPEIAAISPHQDPASDGAAATNKASTLALAKQLALIGVDPLLALESGTFAPGSKTDTTGKGNSCDTQNVSPGCIFTEKLLVLDATPEEVSSAVSGVTATFSGTGAISATDISFSGLSVAGGAAATGNSGAGSGSAAATTTASSSTTSKSKAAATATATSTSKAADANAVDPGTVTVTVTVTPSSNNVAAAAVATSASLPDTCSVVTTTVAAAAAANLPATTTIAATTAAATTAANNNKAAATTAPTATTTDAGTGTNIQSFTGTLGGTAPAVISGTGTRPFTVNGNSFTGGSVALGRSCDIQHNACANAANSGSLSGGVSQCETQNTECHAAITRRSLRRGLRPIVVRAGDFGSCTDPSIAFGKFDGRTENSFKANDQTDFNHGSAQKIGIIAGFICQRLGDSCKADATVVSTCAQASSSAVAATQDQTAADIFNSVMGVSGGSGATATATATASSGSATRAAASSVVTSIVVCSA